MSAVLQKIGSIHIGQIGAWKGPRQEALLHGKVL